MFPDADRCSPGFRQFTFSEPPTVTQFCAALNGVADGWPDAVITEPTNGLHVHIDCH